VFPLREYWIDIGRPDDLRQARAAYPRGFPGD
jgi:NDP-sugar pyrophosphorylase family protein